jgi:distribution and morphology protein 34
MLLRLSHFKLNSYVVLVVSKQKGITLVFKTDPLQNVDINSTFDSIAVIQKFIQREIEGQLRQMFREDLPSIIHRLSQQWVKSTVEAPYLANPPLSSRPTPLGMPSPDLLYRTACFPTIGLQPLLRPQPSRSSSYRHSRSSSVASTSRATAKSAPSLSAHPAASDPSISFPDLENFDPTYGLRPEGLPTKSVFGAFSSLFAPNKGLADLAEESDEYEDEVGSFDIVDWENAVPDVSAATSVSDDAGAVTEYETIPAVGGGTITRPRIYHSQSLVQPPPNVSTPSTRPTLSPLQGLSKSYDHLAPHNASIVPRRTNSTHHFDLSATPDHHPVMELRSSHPHTAPPYALLGRPITPDSLETQPSRSSSGMEQSLLTPPSSEHAQHDEEAPIYMKRPASDRRLLVSLADESSSSDNYSHMPEPDREIILRPSLNNSIHQLSTLSHSNHTLSPYTRSLAHFTVRSVPPKGVGSSGPAAVERQPLKARRKRIYRLGGQSKDSSRSTDLETPPAPSSPVPPSEFDASDMDRYFRSHNDVIPQSLDIHPTHVRRRHSYQPT